MKVHKFFYLTIQGDDLDLEEVQKAITLPCTIFRKGEILTSRTLKKPFPPQKTNRWLYRVIENTEKSSEDFLTEQLTILNAHLQQIENYIVRGMASLELTLYADNATDFQFTNEHVSLLHKLGLELFLSFC